ncbi:diguanylate cyclase [Fusobacterium sp. MFO224]|uniref:sensor domain-containing diguanylate cyclase n=1 Tax=Fusobacterium sp. MFO224 TaxID=3378070 RepID=UPI003851CA64
MLLKNKYKVFFTIIFIPLNYQFIYAHNVYTRGNFTPKEYAFFGALGIIILSFFLIVLISLNYQLRIAKEKLNESRQRFSDVTNAAEEVVWEIGKDSKFNYVSKKVEKVLGYSPIELMEISIYDILKGEDRDKFQNEMLKIAKSNGKFYKKRYRFIHKKNYEIWLQISGVVINDENNKYIGFRGVSSDITREYYQERKLYFLARSDALTGLMNRRFFIEQARKSFKKSKMEHEDFSFAMVDIDYFKNINDKYGHDVGDKVLKDLAVIMKGILKDDYLLGRLGGEEFAYAFPKTGVKSAKEIILNLQNKINEFTFKINDEKINITVSVGISYLNDESDELSTLSKGADIALYDVKNGGRNKIKIQKK